MAGRFSVRDPETEDPPIRHAYELAWAEHHRICVGAGARGQERLARILQSRKPRDRGRRP